MLLTFKRTIVLFLTLAVSSLTVLLVLSNKLDDSSNVVLSTSIDTINSLKTHTSNLFSSSSFSSSQSDSSKDSSSSSSSSSSTSAKKINNSKTINAKSGGKIKAAFVTLARNADLEGIIQSIESVENQFNKRFHYDWVFLNDVEFTDEFKQKVTDKISGIVKFGTIPKSMWSIPKDLDMEKFANAKNELGSKNVPYASSDSYRHMCRFESGFFFNHDLLKEYTWYWRVEPEVEYFCDIDFDPFQYMIDNKKVYGTMLIPYEIIDTIPSLWSTVKSFVKSENLTSTMLGQKRTKDNALYLISEDDGETYNNCHFWTNFEIANLDFFRSELYTKYFNYLDKSNGFWYERWGDAPIHTMAAALFLDKSQIHLFSQQFGYRHTTNTACPANKKLKQLKKCTCDGQKEVTFRTGFTCGKRFHDMQNLWYDSNWVSEWK